MTLKLFYIKRLTTITGLSCLLGWRIKSSASCPESARWPSHTLLPETTRQLDKMPSWHWETGCSGEKGRQWGDSYPLLGFPPEVSCKLGTKKGNPSRAQQGHREQSLEQPRQQEMTGQRRQKKGEAIKSSGKLHRVPWVFGWMPICVCWARRGSETPWGQTNGSSRERTITAEP